MREGERDIRREGGKGRRNASSIGINQRRSEVKGRVGGDTERHMKSRIDVCVCLRACLFVYMWISMDKDMCGGFIGVWGLSSYSIIHTHGQKTISPRLNMLSTSPRHSQNASIFERTTWRTWKFEIQITNTARSIK